MSIAGKNVLILVANGFDENQMTEIQRALTKAKATTKTVGPEQGLVNGWQGSGWGHYFPVDTQINEAMGSDFDILVLPGGERGVAKLKTNPHTRRILNHFMDAEKPIAAIGAGVGLLALTGKLAGRTLAASADVQEDLKAAGATISEDSQEMDATIISASGADLNAWVMDSLEFFNVADESVQQAA